MGDNEVAIRCRITSTRPGKAVVQLGSDTAKYGTVAFRHHTGSMVSVEVDAARLVRPVAEGLADVIAMLETEIAGASVERDEARYAHDRETESFCDGVIEIAGEVLERLKGVLDG